MGLNYCPCGCGTWDAVSPIVWPERYDCRGMGRDAIWFGKHRPALDETKPMQLPHEELRAFAQLIKSCVFPRSRKSVATFPKTLCTRSSFCWVIGRSHVLWEILGQWKSGQRWGQSFLLNSLLCCLAVLGPCVEMFGVSVSLPVQWSSHYR